METQIQVVKMEKYIFGYSSDWILGYFSKYCISNFIEKGSSGSWYTI